MENNIAADLAEDVAEEQLSRCKFSGRRDCIDAVLTAYASRISGAVHGDSLGTWRAVESLRELTAQDDVYSIACERFCGGTRDPRFKSEEFFSCLHDARCTVRRLLQL